MGGGLCSSTRQHAGTGRVLRYVTVTILARGFSRIIDMTDFVYYGGIPFPVFLFSLLQFISLILMAWPQNGFPVRSRFCL